MGYNNHNTYKRRARTRNARTHVANTYIMLTIERLQQTNITHNIMRTQNLTRRQQMSDRKALHHVHARVVELNQLLKDLRYRESTLSHGEDGIDNSTERAHLLKQIDAVEHRISTLLGEV